MECLDCVQTTARLHLYLDRELTNDEVVIVQQHLISCEHCEGRFHFDMYLKRLIHERCTLIKAPDHLREKILQLAHGKNVPLDAESIREIQADLE